VALESAYRPDIRSSTSENYLVDLKRLLDAIRQRKQSDLIQT